MYENIPEELKSIPQWVMWRYEDRLAKKPTKVPYHWNNGIPVNSALPESWGSFADCLSVLRNTNWYDGIGFALTPDDPYAFIDLDDCEGNAEILNRQIRIFEEFTGYAERSPSGNGLHIIVRGAIPAGRKRSAVEIYSSARYMTMTGNVYRPGPIVDHSRLLASLWAQMEAKPVNSLQTGRPDETETDERIYAIAASAVNANKFCDLWAGNWQAHYPSQSEADFALIDILAFYSLNRAQTKRMFLLSQLGQRDKAKRDDYLAWMLNRCFDRLLPPIDIEGLRNQIVEVIEKAKPKRPSVESKLKNIYSVPPGLVGEVAQYIFAKSVRPVSEVAVAGAMGLLSGILGRSYNISNTGLNQYIMFIAKTGIGKEGMDKGISSLIEAVAKIVPSVGEFIGPSQIASAQAIIKHLANGQPSVVSVIGEMGIYLKTLVASNSNPIAAGMRSFLLNVYNKSGEGDVLRPIIYSDKEKNTSTIRAPAFTLLGESTPEKFYEGLTEGLITEGLLPRFSMIEYYGKRPPMNKNHRKVMPSSELVQRMGQLCSHSLTLNSQHKAVHVEMDYDSEALLDKFNVYCDDKINSSEQELNSNLWNRSHVKALKTSALLAVGCNPYNPVINVEMANWAIEIAIADARNMLSRFDAGEIGRETDEVKQITRVVKCIREFLTKAWSDVEKYIPGLSKLHSEKVIPFAYLQRRLVSLPAFREDSKGATMAIKRCIKTLCERGDIEEIPTHIMDKTYHTKAAAYVIKNHNIFGI